MALVSVDREQITVAGTAVGFTAAKITPNVIKAVAYVTTAPIRWYANGDASTAKGRGGNGTAPTSTLGLPADIDVIVEVVGYQDIQNFRMIRSTGTSAVVEVEYFGENPDT